MPPSRTALYAAERCPSPKRTWTSTDWRVALAARGGSGETPAMTTPRDEAFDAGRRVCAALDTTMTRFGFAPGQIGTRPGEASVVFCADHSAFRARFPSLAPEIDDRDAGACTDLYVDVVVEASPRLTEIHLEGYGVDALVADAGRADLLTQAAGLTTSELPEALGALDHILREVLGTASTGTGEIHD